MALKIEEEVIEIMSSSDEEVSYEIEPPSIANKDVLKKVRFLSVKSEIVKK